MAKGLKVQCCDCAKELTKDLIALNQKLNGRSVGYYYCLECLAQALNISEEILEAKIDMFKEQGCALFK